MKCGQESSLVTSIREDPSRDLLFAFKRNAMIKILALVLVLIGMAGLILGVPGVFGPNLIALNPWALSILGFIFFLSGIGLLKLRKDTDEIR